MRQMQQEQFKFTDGGAYQCSKNVVFTKALTNRDELPTAPAWVDFAKGKVWEVEMANTEIDRHRDRFTIEVLQKFADDVNSKPRKVKALWQHNQGLSIGYVFGAYLDNTKLKGFLYVSNKYKIPSQDVRIVDSIEDGETDSVSVGFAGKIRAIKTDSEGYTEIWEWYRPMDGKDDPTELRELSVVTIPAQPNAGIKALDAPQDQKHKSNLNMSTTKSIQVGGKDVEILAKMDGDKITIDTAQFSEAVKALESEKSDLAAKLTAAQTELAAKAAEVQKMREPLETTVLNHQKTKGAAALNEDQVKALPFEQLSAMAHEAEKALSVGGKTTEFESQKSFNNKLI